MRRNSSRCLESGALAAALLLIGALRAEPIPSSTVPTVIVDTTAEPVAAGVFRPTWAYLRQHRVPAWFRDAKFGIWAHWVPQCQSGTGD
jgi:alpha-L-fucosidase